MIAATWGTGQVVFDILWFFLILVEVYLTIVIFIDLFRRHDMKGWLKALWVLLILILPLVGILLYLVIYGDQMRVHAQQAAGERDREFQSYVRHVAGSSNPGTELAHLDELRQRGVITDDEFQQLKARVLNG